MIRFSLIKKEWREQRWIILLGLIILILLGLFMAFSFEWLVVKLDGLEINQFNGPRWLQKSLNTIPQIKDYSYALWSNWNPKNLIQIGTIMAVLLGIITFAGEIEHRTVTFLLTNRLTRKNVFRSKIVATILSLGVIFFIPTLLLPLFSFWSGHTLTHLRIIGASFVTYLGGLCVLSLTVYISIKLQDRIKTLLVMFLILFFQVLLGFIPYLEYLSLFKYTSAAAYYFGVTSFPWLTATALVVISVLLIKYSEYTFKKSDFS